MKVKVFLFSCLLSFAMTSLQAQTQTPKVTQQQVTQHKRIGQGVRSGELTRKETRELQRQQRSIHRNKKRAQSDGIVTPRERVRLDARQKNASGNIYQKKHNDRSRN